MAIPFNEQFFVEADRNLKYQFLAILVSILLPICHGVLFSWIPWILRGKRSAESLTHKPFFTFLKYYETLTRTFSVSIFKTNLYFQPSLLIVAALHVGTNAAFAIAETRDLTYEDWEYIVSKRIGRLSIAHIPIILILVAKNNLVSAASGLGGDKLVFFHKWYGRSMFITTVLHMAYSLKYWLGLDFKVMVQIPPQIFGFIAFSCLGMLNAASLKFIRNFAFEFFLAQHRIFNFVMLLLAYFHNGGTHAAVVLGVHLLVLDRIVGRVLGVLHKRKGPSKGVCDFEILDETTVRISIPISVRESSGKWFWNLIPRYGTWRAGQHVQFNCNKIALLAYHPFTIASLPESGSMVLVIKTQRGFTKKLHDKLTKMSTAEDEENSIELADCVNDSIHTTDELAKTQYEEKSENLSEPSKRFKSLVSNFKSPRIFKIKAGINGPFGGNYQPLTKFDSVVFFSAGSGASFTLPVALDLLKTLQKRDEADDFLYRPQRAQITIVVAMKRLANLQWYDHLWREFLPFLNSGRASIALHLTQECAETSQVDPTTHDKEKSEVREGTSSLSENSSSGSILGFESGFSITYRRPDFEKIISSSVHELCSSSYRKAFASIGCGPGDFNHRIKSACDKGRWFKNAPDVYCYEESFE